MADLAEAPVNVRVVFDTGRFVPVELSYQGFVDGLHVWRATQSVKLDEDAGWVGITADTVPPDTKLEVVMVP